MKAKNILHFLSLMLAMAFPMPGNAQYTPREHVPIPAGAIAVDSPGSYDKAGASYCLTRDISGSGSTVFLGKDVTLDLNGYTLTYADGNYQHVVNYGFEEGLTGWDVSKAPGAKIENTSDVHVFIGQKLMRLKAGDIITSSPVYLPVEGRSYYALCGVTGNYYTDMGGDLSRDMRISIFVEDSAGNQVKCLTRYGDSARISCPVINRSANLGGGFVFAHLTNLPSGKYRITVKAENDCLVDEIDIRPALDAGIGIVEKTHPMGHYDHLINRDHTAFFDYTSDTQTGAPVTGIPVVTGTGTVTIKNGIIKNGTVGILSWGIQSTAENVRIILDNVMIVSSGINTIAMDVPQATITNCTFDIQNPFIINRHGSEFYAVDLRGEQASEVSNSDFYGGQGCLCIKGKFSSVYHNRFVNRQTVTNHYSIMAMGDGSRIFENVFIPESGSGIEIFRHRNIDIFNNEFHIQAAPPSCEYNDLLSTNAIRIADYGAPEGSPEGSYGNRVYNNVFYITGRKYKKYPDFIPLASAFFYSASGGDNDIFGNEIHVNQEDPESDAGAYAFYIGNARGGRIHSNVISSNVTPIWVACPYGRDEKTDIAENTIEKTGTATAGFFALRMGSHEQPDFLAYQVKFRSNEVRGLPFSVDATDQHHVYSVYWTLTIRVYDSGRQLAAGKEVQVADRNGQKVAGMQTDSHGRVAFELLEYAADGDVKTSPAPYTVSVGKKKIRTTLTHNTTLDIEL